jgi:chaperonin GroES
MSSKVKEAAEKPATIAPVTKAPEAPKPEAAEEAFPWEVLDDGVVVVPDKAPEKSKAGIIIANSENRKLCSGTVLALGPGRRESNGEVTSPTYKEGATVFFGRYAGEEIEVLFKEQKLVLLRMADVRMTKKA